MPIAWSVDAWPLPLASEALPDRRAAAAWSQVGPAAWAPVAWAPPAVDGRVSVAAVDAAGWAEQVGDASLVAFTLVTHEAGALQDADVLLNTDRFALVDPPAPRAFSRQTVVAHELGHALGLGHPCGDAERPACAGALGEALMAPRLAPGDDRSPTADDVAGLEAYSAWRGPARRPQAVAERVDAATWRVSLADVRAGDLLVAHSVTGPASRRVPDGPTLELAAGVEALEVWSLEGQGVVIDRPHTEGPEPPLAAEPSASAPPEGCSSADGAAPVALACLLFAGLLRRGARDFDSADLRTMTDAEDRRGEDDST